LLDQVRALAADVSEAYSGTPAAGALADVADRLDEPLRVAIAGRVKAGKSTLLNALVGDELAPTDAGECTRIVTWYRYGLTYRASLQLQSGERRPVPFGRSSGAIEVDLQGRSVDDVDHLTIEWPSEPLRTLTLIDTPGIGSARAATSARSLAFLTPDDDDAPTPSDAVVYLLRHLHAVDVQFLEAFTEEEYVLPSPVNALAVLSRADEVGAGRLDSLRSAERIAGRYRADARLRVLVQDVVPVAGLLAQVGWTLREAEFRQLRAIAGLPSAAGGPLLLTADRFANMPDDTLGAVLPRSDDPLPSASERRDLLGGFGLFGVGLSFVLFGAGVIATAGQLAAELRRQSGIDRLRGLLLTQFAQRRDTLKARSALAAVEGVLARYPLSSARAFEARVEQLRAGAHAFAELRLLNSLRSGALAFSAAEVADAERLLGISGPRIEVRLGLGEGEHAVAGNRAPSVRTALVAALNRWRARAESPLSAPPEREAARIVVRSCEELFSALS
jgi:hypothetical protein